MTTVAPSTETHVPDLYPTRGSAEVITPRQDPGVWGAPDAPGPITPADLGSFERDGFLAVDRLITEDEVAVYRDELDRLIADPAIRADERSIVEPRSKE